MEKFRKLSEPSPEVLEKLAKINEQIMEKINIPLPPDVKEIKSHTS